MAPVPGVPIYEADLFDDAALANPYPRYKTLRDLGPVVWLARHGMYAMARFEDVRAALRDHRLFSSALGVAANPVANTIAAPNTLTSDPPQHTAFRRVVGAPLMPSELAKEKARIAAMAETLVDELWARRSFDAAPELAHVLPLRIVSELVGLPDDGRRNMLRWAGAAFNALGVENARCLSSRPVVQEMRAYLSKEATRERVRPGSWIDRLHAAGDRGEIDAEHCPALSRDYVGPSLDTTIFATTNLIWLMGRHPEQWTLLRSDPSLIPAAINEALRLESPARGFSRVLTGDFPIGGATLPAGARIMLFYASANRDERKWSEPEAFDIRRKASEHLGFGNGVHSCVGMHLARLEIACLLEALVRKVARIEIRAAELDLNNMLRGFRRLEVTLH